MALQAAEWLSGHTSALLRATKTPLVGADPNIQTQAKRTAVNVPHFFRIFMDAAGTSPHQDIPDTRLAFARGLLIRSRSPTLQIAEQCGSSSPCRSQRPCVATTRSHMQSIGNRYFMTKTSVRPLESDLLCLVTKTPSPNASTPRYLPLGIFPRLRAHSLIR